MKPSFVMTSRWWLQAEPTRVWPLVGDPGAWPRWLTSVTESAARPASAALRWAMPWPWACDFALLDRHADGPHQFGCRLQGPLRTRWACCIEAHPGLSADLTLRVEISLDRPWMRRLSPWLLPWLARRHFAALRAGVPRMGELLGCAVSVPSEWSGHKRL